MDIQVGDRVRAVYPNASWGEGTVLHVGLVGNTVFDERRGQHVLAKPYMVRRDDGTVGCFNEGMIERVGSGPETVTAMARSARPAPGDRVRLPYRPMDIGAVLSDEDQRAWANTAVFPVAAPDPVEIAEHVAWCRMHLDEWDRRVPVLYSDGRVYWERTEHLQVVETEQ